VAITTDNGKLAVLSLNNLLMPNLPLSPGALGQDDQQQLLWGFPEILWAAPSVEATTPGGSFTRKDVGRSFTRKDTGRGYGGRR